VNDRSADEVIYFCDFLLDLVALVDVYAVETTVYADELLHEPKLPTFFEASSSSDDLDIEDLLGDDIK
jgi:hypothetical protein